ncbi:RmlD-like substrate binding domain-containing protein [Pilaira anomala]|nr:RmlD-like substrate binding domain-containing protein [Pilaira anomala]
MKVIVTGGSGLLGRPAIKEFEKAGCDVVGTAFSRAKNGLVKLDLTDSAAVENFIDVEQPDVVVHCAAERRPDVAEKDREGVLRLNVETPKALARICKKRGIMLIYISTDYVFDGTTPPYEVEDKPNPLQFYGETKLAGEEAIKSVYPEAVILRVPILYGPTEYNGESAINILIDVVLNHDKPTTVDNVSSRYPTNVEDVARVIKDLAVAKVQNNKDIKGIYHFTGQESITKYQVCEIVSKILGAPIDHLTPQNTIDKAASVSRPENSHLSIKQLKEAGIDTSFIRLADWFSKNLLTK